MVEVAGAGFGVETAVYLLRWMRSPIRDSGWPAFETLHSRLHEDDWSWGVGTTWYRDGYSWGAGAGRWR